MMPELSKLLRDEYSRHVQEVADIRAFHVFMSQFFSSGEIDGRKYLLSAISIEDKVAMFQSCEGLPDYFLDIKNPPVVSVGGGEMKVA